MNDEKTNSQNKSKKIMIVINLIAIAILLGIAIFVFFYFYDDFKQLNDPQKLQEYINKITNTGFLGALIFILIQILQVVVAFIPGEAVEIVAGAMFGPLLGLILCLIGLNLATLIIFGLVKLLGKPFVNENVKEKTQSRLKFLQDPNRSLVIIFFIFLIPGIPKDILIYPIPLTKIKMWKFMIVSSIARIPSILSSNFIGAAILKQNYLTAGIIFGVFLLLAVIGLIFNKKIYEVINKIFAKRK